MKPYKKVGELKTFKIVKFIKKFYQKWEDTTKKYVNHDTYFEGSSARYLFELEDCMCHFSKDQIGQMLINIFEGTMPMEGHIFSVKTNGQTGKEVRYYINKGKQEDLQPAQVSEELTTDNIPF